MAYARKGSLAHILVVLSISYVLTFSTEQPECDSTKVNVYSGNFQHVAKGNCSWTYIAPHGMKLLFKVDNVKFPALQNSTLKIFADSNEIDIPRSCVKCLQQMISGRVVKLVYRSFESSLDLDEEASSGTFQIRYKAFYPDVCDKPKSPRNGFAKVLGHTLGQDVFYSCSPPYEMVGLSQAQCIVVDDSPIPRWSNGPPNCIVPNCTGETIEKVAGSGAIASPSYPTYKLNSPMRCEWVLTSAIGYQIRASFSVVQLTGPGNDSVGSLLLYDGDENRPFLAFNQTIWSPHNFSTKTNKLVVRLNTFNKDTVDGGFLMAYSAIPGSCPEPSPPHFGEVVAYSLSVGSIVAYRCMPGYSLVGGSQSECLSGGVWSSRRPKCRPITTVPPTVTSTLQTTTLAVPLHHSTVLIPTVLVGDSTTYSNTETERTVNNASVKTVKLQSMLPEIVISEIVDIENVPNSTTPLPKTQDKINPVSLTNTAFDKGVEVKPKSPIRKDANEVSGQMAPHYVVSNSQPEVNHEDKSSLNGSGTQSNFTTLIVVGIASGVLLILLSLLAAVLVYRKRHPTSMRFTRKFSTFENPMYVRKEVCHPRELKRLTV